MATSTARLEARISTDLHAMLKRVAELQGRTMTDFVVAAVQEAAQRAIGRSGVLCPGIDVAAATIPGVETRLRPSEKALKH